MATTKDLAKWGYDNYGASLDYRNTELWSILDPLLQSPFVPKDWGKFPELLDTAQKNFKKDVERQLNFETKYGLAEESPDFFTEEEDLPEVPEDYLEGVSSFSSVNIEDQSFGPGIDYEVFFQE